MSFYEKQTIQASFLRPGEHELRPPGETEFLAITDIGPSPRQGEVIVTAGGREFTTLPTTMWPCRMAADS